MIFKYLLSIERNFFPSHVKTIFFVKQKTQNVGENVGTKLSSFKCERLLRRHFLLSANL